MSEISHTAILGAGVIGASWAALFLARSLSMPPRQMPKHKPAQRLPKPGPPSKSLA